MRMVSPSTVCVSCSMVMRTVCTVHTMVRHVNVVFPMVKQSSAGKDIPSKPRSIRDDRQRNVQRCRSISPEVDVVCVGNVVDDKVAWIRFPVISRRRKGIAHQAKTQQQGEGPFQILHIALVVQGEIEHRLGEFGCEDSPRIPYPIAFSHQRAQNYQTPSVGGTEWRMDSATRIAVNAAYRRYVAIAKFLGSGNSNTT